MSPPRPVAGGDAAGIMGGTMPRRRSFTSTLYKAARLSNNARAARRGPVEYEKRVVRRKVYGKTMGGTSRLLRLLGLSGKRRR
jgi:hypothetical protein